MGYIANKTCNFRVGEGYAYDEKETAKINDGNFYGKVPAISVFTNFDLAKHHEELLLIKEYDPNKYLKYFNYDAIEVGRVKDIPNNYYDIIGVPITFLSEFNPEQFEIIGLTSLAETMDKPVMLGTEFVDLYKKQGGTGHFSVNMYGVWYVDFNGKAVKPYGRILIRRKQQEVQ